MKANLQAICGVAIGLAFVGWQTSDAWAANFYPVFTDINAQPAAFGNAAAATFGGVYTSNSAAKLNGNDVLAFNQNNACGGCGAVMEINVSNGENGVNSTEGGTNIDIPNPTPANSAFAAIGNASGKLENGNVLRFSVWFRSDPANPITQEPQVAPIIKFEFWKEALSGNQDANGTKPAPAFGDRVFDQDQQGEALNIPDLPHYGDINGDGFAGDANASVANGRVTPIVTNQWNLATVTYTVDTTQWLGIGAEAFGANNVSVIESVKAVFFMGDFANTDLTGDGPDGGNLLLDNALVEVFKNAASVTPLNNPNPTLSEGHVGDYNGDGVVNAADYTVWRDHLGQTFALQNRDPANTGAISNSDYTSWKNNFGVGAGSGSLSGSAVPEPTSLCLTFLGALMVGGGYCRRG